MQPLDEIAAAMNQILQCLLDPTGILIVLIPKSDRQIRGSPFHESQLFGEGME
jgi:hypothetical protein